MGADVRRFATGPVVAHDRPGQQTLLVVIRSEVERGI